MFVYNNQDAIAFSSVDENGENTQIDRTTIWNPDEVGEKTFTIRVEYSNCFYGEQKFAIKALERVTQIDSPVISSVPTGPAYVGERYSYQITAQMTRVILMLLLIRC
jgi:hypothetical protein